MFLSVGKAVVMLALNMSQKNDTLWNLGDVRMNWNNYECDGQLTITDLLKSKIELRKVMDFTEFLNSQGKSQYQQIGSIVRKTYEENKLEPTERMLDRITNDVSVYVLGQAIKYADYLRSESKLD